MYETNKPYRVQNNSLVMGREILCKYIIKEPVMILVGINASNEYKDGVRTDKVIGYTYECVDVIDFKHLKIKIEGQKVPLMTNDELQKVRERGEHVQVEFVNAVIRAYINYDKGSIEDSIKAEDVRLVNED